MGYKPTLALPNREIHGPPVSKKEALAGREARGVYVSLRSLKTAGPCPVGGEIRKSSCRLFLPKI